MHDERGREASGIDDLGRIGEVLLGACEQGVEFLARDAFGHGHAIAPRRIDAFLRKLDELRDGFLASARLPDDRIRAVVRGAGDKRTQVERASERIDGFPDTSSLVQVFEGVGQDEYARLGGDAARPSRDIGERDVLLEELHRAHRRHARTDAYVERVDDFARQMRKVERNRFEDRMRGRKAR